MYVEAIAYSSSTSSATTLAVVSAIAFAKSTPNLLVIPSLCRIIGFPSINKSADKTVRYRVTRETKL